MTSTQSTHNNHQYHLTRHNTICYLLPIIKSKIKSRQKIQEASHLVRSAAPAAVFDPMAVVTTTTTPSSLTSCTLPNPQAVRTAFPGTATADVMAARLTKADVVLPFRILHFKRDIWFACDRVSNTTDAQIQSKSRPIHIKQIKTGSARSYNNNEDFLLVKNDRR